MRKLLVLSMLLITTIFLAACGKESNSSTDTDWPTKPIQLIVSYAPGGGTDIGARLLATYIEDELGVPVTIINKPGGGGWVGWTDLVNAKPDGQTIGYINTPNLMTGYINPELKRKQNLDDFAVIANHITDPGVIAVRSGDDRFETIDDIIEYAKNNDVTTTSTGLAGDDHIAALKINKAHGTKFKAVHSTGASESKASVLGGHIDAYFANVGEVALEAKNGELKILAVMSDERTPFLPDVPTLKEAGYGDIVSWSARGIAAPKGIDPEKMEILARAFENGINNPEHIKKMNEMGLTIDYRNSKNYREMLSNEEADILKLVDLLGW